MSIKKYTQQEVIEEAARVSKDAVTRFILAGGEVLRVEFGFNDEQIGRWMQATGVMGQKYLKINTADGRKIG